MKILIALNKAIDNFFGLLKVFVNYISEGLHKEYADKGIVVQVSDRQTQSVRCMHCSIRIVLCSNFTPECEAIFGSYSNVWNEEIKYVGRQCYIIR